MKNKDLCKKENRIFGEYFEHTFRYKNKEERKCSICGEVEIYIGINNTNYHEDWRPKLNS